MQKQGIFLKEATFVEENAKSEYEILKSFWDGAFSDMTVSPITSTFIEDPAFKETIAKYLRPHAMVLDYGCGPGWMLFELSLMEPLSFGMGIDTSKNAIDFATECASLSKTTNLSFHCGDESILAGKDDFFDFAISVNTLDVIPDFAIDSVLEAIYKAMKKDGILIVSLNPFFSEDDFRDKLKMDKQGHYYYKNGILRANDKTEEEWMAIFNKRFRFLEKKTCAFIEREKAYPRRMFILKK